jgi:hypothetical protein
MTYECLCRCETNSSAVHTCYYDGLAPDRFSECLGNFQAFRRLIELGVRCSGHLFYVEGNCSWNGIGEGLHDKIAMRLEEDLLNLVGSGLFQQWTVRQLYIVILVRVCSSEASLISIRHSKERDNPKVQGWAICNSRLLRQADQSQGIRLRS